MNNYYLLATGRAGVWRGRGTRFQRQFVTPLRRSGRKTQNYWGWFSYKGRGKLIRVNRRLNGVRYAGLLDKYLWPSLQQLFPGDGPINVIEDGS